MAIFKINIHVELSKCFHGKYNVALRFILFMTKVNAVTTTLTT